METGSLTTLGSSDSGSSSSTAQNLTSASTTTQNSDGSTTVTKTTSDADGNVVGTDTKVTQADGSYNETIKTIGPNGKTLTKNITGENTDDGFLESSTLTDSDGNVWETASTLTATDGSVTKTSTQNGPSGDSTTETASYDAAGQLLTASTS